MITLTPMIPSHLEQVMTLSVAEEQRPFVGTIDEVLLNADDKVHPHLVMKDQCVVGIFLIDTQYFQLYPFADPTSLGFRAFLIDEAQQGFGYGQQALGQLAEYLARHYPDSERVFLTVNCRNALAYHCYIKVGFVDSPEKYLGGAAGPQHIMSLALKE
ncbi:GNAT family N-acetyltransferase [Vibrio sp. JPW-9-11-11]|uniref:GNAT family N-acetyltransferase n=1 Tax=Vibrio sp. JPW-9-11-11 TaxID=1416532 RepID=UPI0015931630|nr:GNAT family N-acetyltransferase [Vibrio sp. JPW-9-11-11]NVD08019.1 GNAT family N-acetyltransferase [Vibrio sp. JPW-9-11-11]